MCFASFSAATNNLLVMSEMTDGKQNRFPQYGTDDYVLIRIYFVRGKGAYLYTGGMRLAAAVWTG